MVKIFALNKMNFGSNRNFVSYTGRIFKESLNPSTQSIHATNPRQLPLAATLPLPNNIVDINGSETGRFSPLRTRDIAGPVINAHNNEELNKIDVTLQSDPHVASYDCRGAVSLSSSMQSNVPSPFSGNHSHLGMPGAQWGQGYKYLSEHLHSSHYLTLRNGYRDVNDKSVLVSGTVTSRCMSTKTTSEKSELFPKEVSVTYKEKLKVAAKDYGPTVMVLHVTLSLVSLGSIYLGVSSGLDVASILEYVNLGEGKIKSLLNSNASTFVVAYAIHKLIAPVRIAVTLTVTPFVVRYLRRVGVLTGNTKIKKNS